MPKYLLPVLFLSDFPLSLSMFLVSLLVAREERPEYRFRGGVGCENASVTHKIAHLARTIIEIPFICEDQNYFTVIP